QAAEGLFRGGEIPDLANLGSDAAKVEVQPVKDLRVAMVLALASLETDGFTGFADALSLIERLLITYWDKVYPLQNEKDPEGEIYARRVNALSPLCFEDPAKKKLEPGENPEDDAWQIEKRLLKVTLLESDRHGAVTLRDCLSPWAKARKITLTS